MSFLERRSTVPLARVRLGSGVVVGRGCVLGSPKEARLRESTGLRAAALGPVAIGDGSILANCIVIHEGVRIGRGCALEDRVRIGYDTIVSDDCRLLYGAYICDRVQIGSSSRVAGFVCDASVIGDRTTSMGQLVHEYSNPDSDWWADDEPAPRIADDVVIGMGALVVGGVSIGRHSYVTAGAVVTRDVPAGSVVTGINTLTPLEDWPGERLQGLFARWLADS